MLTLQFLQSVQTRIMAIHHNIPDTLKAKVLFEILLEEFENTLPRSVSSIQRPDILSYFSSTPTYAFDYLLGSVEFKYAENTIQIRYIVTSTEYEDSFGFVESLNLLEKIIQLGEHPTTPKFVQEEAMEQTDLLQAKAA